MPPPATRPVKYPSSPAWATRREVFHEASYLVAYKFGHYRLSVAANGPLPDGSGPTMPFGAGHRPELNKVWTNPGRTHIQPLPMSMEPKAISIRRAGEADAAAIARLCSVLGYAAEPAVVAGRLRAILHADADLMIVAEDSQRAVVGWLQAHAAHIVESGFRVEITGLVVSPAQRRRGVGRALVAEAERWAGAVAAGAVVVRSDFRRAESHVFYPALGYIATKTQNVYRKVLTK